MNTTIVYNLDIKKAEINELKNERNYYFTEKQKDAYLYHIDNINVDSYIINTAGMNSTLLNSMIEQIHYLNSIITILLYKPEQAMIDSLKMSEHIIPVDSVDKIRTSLKEIIKVSRSSNRVEWPLQVIYWQPENIGKTRKKAKVLSLSSNGCYIKTNPILPFKKGGSIAMTFSFSYFDFYSDGEIVRIESEREGQQVGIAVGFKDISSQTQKCIKEIIDEKILSEIMITLD